MILSSLIRLSALARSLADPNANPNPNPNPYPAAAPAPVPRVHLMRQTISLSELRSTLGPNQIHQVSAVSPMTAITVIGSGSLGGPEEPEKKFQVTFYPGPPKPSDEHEGEGAFDVTAQEAIKTVACTASFEIWGARTADVTYDVKPTAPFAEPTQMLGQSLKCNEL